MFLVCRPFSWLEIMSTKTKTKLRALLVRKRTIPTERPPIVGEVVWFNGI
jgi:hypothetical protein